MITLLHLQCALEVARQLHDARKALYIDAMELHWDADVSAPPPFALSPYLKPFIALGALRTEARTVAGRIFLPRRRQQVCPLHHELCLPTREDETHRTQALAWYATLTTQGHPCPTFLVDLLDPWPRDSASPGVKRTQAKALPAALRYYVMQRDGFRCQLCGVSPHDGHGFTLEVDHKVSRAHGGKDDPDNLLTLCDLCNSGKGMQDL